MAAVPPRAIECAPLRKARAQPGDDGATCTPSVCPTKGVVSLVLHTLPYTAAPLSCYQSRSFPTKVGHQKSAGLGLGRLARAHREDGALLVMGSARQDVSRLLTTSAITADASQFRTTIRNIIAASRSSPLALASYCKEGVVPALATSLTQARIWRTRARHRGVCARPASVNSARAPPPTPPPSRRAWSAAPALCQLSAARPSLHHRALGRRVCARFGADNAAASPPAHASPRR